MTTTKKSSSAAMVLTIALASVSLSALTSATPLTQSASAQTAWKMPWNAGLTPRINGGWHYDGFLKINTALDVGLPAGSVVRVPIKSTVTSFCNAGNNHLGILLRASDGRQYTLTHVTSTGVRIGRTYNQGEQIGVVAADRPWNNCAKSTGPHLHFGLPSQNMTIDSQNLSSTRIPSPLRSTNK
jgi:murein DD-endopeptidase MepM/ murein hydrolase activator NlpD